MTLDIMLDLETLDNKVPAAITQIGAIAFDRRLRKPIDEVSINVDADSCQKRGMTISGSTVMWWLKQAEDVRRSLVDPVPVDIDQALNTFRTWLFSHFPSTRTGIHRPGEVEKFRVWCHASFDFPIINRAFDLCNIPTPWGYRDYVDLRTMVSFANVDPADYAEVAGAHNALADAKFQLRYTFASLEKLENSH